MTRLWKAGPGIASDVRDAVEMVTSRRRGVSIVGERAGVAWHDVAVDGNIDGSWGVRGMRREVLCD